jgi:hypothetical protein
MKEAMGFAALNPPYALGQQNSALARIGGLP